MRCLIIILLRLEFIFLLGAGLVACDFKASKHPSVLIIAVENLNSDDFTCDSIEPEYEDGVGLLCQDGVRFTHAFTPSTLSQASLGSILTGQYPKSLGLRHNGQHYLTENVYTVAELALEQGYRSSFFSGGAPVWRKSGLDQGFEFFEDNLSINHKSLYRPIERNVDYFLKWLEDVADSQPFFSMIYAADLQYSLNATVDQFGKERAISRESQLKEINESLIHLFSELKLKKRWDNTYIIITGLNGVNRLHMDSELAPLNLYSENTQVFLMIKPAHRARDSGQFWTIDANVTLVDLGATLYDILGEPEQIRSGDSYLDVSSLKEALHKPTVTWKRDRVILVESAWADWREIGQIRYSIRQNQFLYIHDLRPKLFNTLVDRAEQVPLNMNENFNKHAMKAITAFVQFNQLPAWEDLTAGIEAKIRIAQKINRSEYDESLKMQLHKLIRKYPWDKQLVGWMASIALSAKDWGGLLKLAEEHLEPIWEYVARRNRGESVTLRGHECMRLLLSGKALTSANCNDLELTTFSQWQKANSSQTKQQLEGAFIREYLKNQMASEISEANFGSGLIWDTALSIPRGPRAIELILNLPEYKGIKRAVEEKIK